MPEDRSVAVVVAVLVPGYRFVVVQVPEYRLVVVGAALVPGYRPVVVLAAASVLE